MIDRRLLLRAWGIMGLVAAALVLAAFFAVLLRAGWHWGADASDGSPLHLAYLQATTASFAGIVACQLGAAMASRAEYASLRSIGFLGNRLLLGSMAFEVVSAAAVIYRAALQTVFGTAGLPLWVVLMMLPFPVLVWSADELYRWIGRRRRKPHWASPDPGVPKSLSERTQDPTGDVVGRVC